jgi:hypothetical protein
MALINCSECDHEVSEKAEACPKCGNPIAPVRRAPMAAQPTSPVKKTVSGARKLLGVVALVVVVGALISTMSNHSDNSASQASSGDATQTAQAPEPAPPPEETITISAADIYTQYKANEVLADSKYKGKKLAVRGVVAEIGKDFTDDPYVRLSAGEDFDWVQASFSKDNNGELAKLQKGQTITITCHGKGMVISSPILDCK